MIGEALFTNQALVVLENTSWHEALWNATAILDPGRPVYLCWGQQNGNPARFSPS